MSAIIAFDSNAKMPAYLANRTAAMLAINADAVSGGASFPSISIKGKVFTLVKDGERKVLTRADDPEEALQSIEMAIVRANNKSRVYYARKFTDGVEGVEARPDCYSSDSIAPAADAVDPQASKCQLCPHSVWGSKVGDGDAEGKGTACTVNTRLALLEPQKIEGVDEPTPFLLRVPAGSRSNFSAAVKVAEARGIPYNALIVKIAFDKLAPAPKLTFKVTGLLDDSAYGVVSGLYEDETIKEIVGLGPVREARAALPAPARAMDDDEAAIEAAIAAALAAKAARTKADQEAAENEAAVQAAEAAMATAKAKATPTPVAEDDEDDELAALMAKVEAVKAAKAAKAAPPAPAVEVTKPVKPVKAAKPVKAVEAATPPAARAADTSEEIDDLLGGLDSLLASTDD